MNISKIIKKSIVYRLYSIFLTFIISKIVTNDIRISIIISLTDSLIKTINYFIFEYIYEKK